MTDLELVKDKLRRIKEELAAKKAEKQGYLNIAADVGEIYERMSEDKDLITGYYRGVKSFSSEKFNTFEGNLYSEKYKVQLEALIRDYKLIISNIDTNMDRLNMIKCEYENKAYKCDGPIGYLQASVNTLVHTIENWVN